MGVAKNRGCDFPASNVHIVRQPKISTFLPWSPETSETSSRHRPCGPDLVAAGPLTDIAHASANAMRTTTAEPCHVRSAISTGRMATKYVKASIIIGMISTFKQPY